ncbi:MAG: hypothetical protein ACRD29_01765 [Acidimicrobiales bacterium]
MIETTFTRLVGCRLPIQVAPMGAISTPALVATASNAGAFGMTGIAVVGHGRAPATDVTVSSRRRRAATKAPAPSGPSPSSRRRTSADPTITPSATPADLRGLLGRRDAHADEHRRARLAGFSVRDFDITDADLAEARQDRARGNA